ncbi:hypothetical protein [Paraburkholderia tagetis]|uniref:Uncharacterized protein n=1 Tax=Paraburkholderia tagetis TaxID=2913261 RepID=A0A9X1UE03_9BURK|nr:hypothetical protein [Paraburkholderia tagetis]MCG5073149.1 hypothetical protein [Paraburkholderia tagetis]
MPLLKTPHRRIERTALVQTLSLSITGFIATRRTSWKPPTSEPWNAIAAGNEFKV